MAELVPEALVTVQAEPVVQAELAVLAVQVEPVVQAELAEQAEPVEAAATE